MQNRTKIREIMRQKRANLTEHGREIAAYHLKNQIQLNTDIANAHNIAAYLACNNEIDPLPWIKEIYQSKNCYLPVVNIQSKHMQFAQFTANTKLLANKYGILEPDEENQIYIPLQELDIVLLPLVAFDLNGNRVGTGAGYYDRTFAFLKNNNLRKPKLIGLAYEFQKIDLIETESWDVELDGIITDSHFFPSPLRCEGTEGG